MHVVDASVWVSRFVPGDEHHLLSRSWLARCVSEGDVRVSPALVLPEVAGAISRRTDSTDLGNRAVKLLLKLPNARLVLIDGLLAGAAAGLAAELHLRGADAVYLAVSYRLGIPLVTWDQEQLARGGRVTTVLTPEQALKD
ncbi:MAG: type II toxin-antitoxin system VapC family toxin [Chloroflexi bacterium]|nr:type II toxin-antitoxin system VapC family toxin [Chloroflexota bacterium]